MPNNMENLWSEAVWKEINDAVLKEVGQIRVAQKIFPTAKLDNPQTVTDDRLNLAGFSIEEGRTKPFIEISAGFPLTPNQVASEATQKNGQKLSKLRAKDLALAEDLIIFQGTSATLPAGVTAKNLTNESVGTGLLGIATPVTKVYTPPITPIPVTPRTPATPGVKYGEETFNAVVKGIAQLNSQLQPGPFALILEYSIFADTYSAIGPSFTTTADRIIPLVTGGFFGTAALPAATGLLVSLGGEPTTLYVGVEASTAFAQKEKDESHFFRVFERIQFNARDPRAFVRLNFT